MEPALKEKFIIIDGNSLLHRAFYAIPALQSSSGEHTNAVYGFTNMLMKLLEDEQPAYAAVAFDPPGPSFRHAVYEAYKGHRQKTPAELVEQMQRAREILEAMRIPVFEVDNFEADDVIGTLAERADEKSLETVVVSGDADLLQLVGGAVTVLLTRKGITQMERYDPKLLQERFGLEPRQVIDFKALKGDPSDHIPGVPGVGEKTARRLLEEYSSVENLYASRERLDEKLRSVLEQHWDRLFTGRDLVALRRDVPLDFSWEQCRRGDPDYPRLLKLFGELEFKSLAARVRQIAPAAPVELSETPGGEAVEDEARLEQLLDGLPAGANLALLAEAPPGRPYWRENPSLLALALSPDQAYYLDPERFDRQGEAIWRALARAWGRGVTLIGHNNKYFYNYCHLRQLPAPPFAFDTELAAYLLEPTRGSYGLHQLIQEYLDCRLSPPAAAPGKQKEQLSPGQRGRILAACAGQLFPLRQKLDAMLRQQELQPLYYELELPLVAVLAGMERQGFAVDLAVLGGLAAEIRGRLEELEEEIYRLAGERFNLNSPPQLSCILFEKLRLPVVRKTKTGRSTDARVLEELACHHEIVAKLLHYRQLVKLEGTYLSGLAPLVDPAEKKIYTTLNQTVTATGRLSSSDPNLQNIPIRLEEGRRIRRAFVPAFPAGVLFAADYSQIELRILAHLSRDPILLEAFTSDEDIHRRTAAEVFHVPPEEVTEAMRTKAKAVNFGIIYGISDYGLGQGLGVSRQEAQRYIDSYFERYLGVKEYVAGIVKLAREAGYVTTLLNRRRYLPELRSAHFGRRSFAERIARNTPIQGSAADIIKLAMLRIDAVIREGGFKAKMLLQIHDELLFEVEERELPFFAPVARREMEQAFTLSVPLKVDLKWGRSWAELKPL